MWRNPRHQWLTWVLLMYMEHKILMNATDTLIVMERQPQITSRHTGEDPFSKFQGCREAAGGLDLQFAGYLLHAELLYRELN